MYVRSDKAFLLDNTYCNKYCPKLADCVRLADETFRQMRKVNVVINRFADGKISVIRRDEFCVPERIINDKVDRSRLF